MNTNGSISTAFGADARILPPGMPNPVQEEREGTEGFRVEDRRTFDASGERRKPDSEASPPRSHEEPSASVDATPLLRLVSGISAGALLGLGLLPDPMSGKPRVDLAAAREAIDLLSVLREKTEGNLTAAERESLDATLHELRMLFIRCTREQDPGAPRVSNDPGDQPA